jgi:hypothetical protein
MSKRKIKDSLPNQKSYPEAIYVGAEAYKITFEDMRDFGMTNFSKQRIYIKKGMSPRETFSTFIHEVLHAMEHEHNIRIKHKVIYKLEKALYELLVDNFL